MTRAVDPVWDGCDGTAGGSQFAAALRELITQTGRTVPEFALASGFEECSLGELLAGQRRAAISELARLARALKLRAIDFMQRTQILSLDVYAAGLDPLYFLPEGTIRKDARIYMREINPRHAVPERDMFVRNPTLRAILADELLDDDGKLELELTYLLRTAIQQTGGTL